MKYQELIKLFKERPFFEVGELRVMFRESPEQIQANLSRWVSGGKLIKLRRTKYLLPEEFRHGKISKGYISNYLYRPSYISLRTALSIYGMIPETVYSQEAVSTRKTSEWVTPLGIFKYYSISRERFWGYKMYNLEKDKNSLQQNFMIGLPEKVLLDLFYLHSPDWNKSRIEEMRFQNIEQINPDRMRKFAEKFGKIGIKKISDLFLSLYF